MLKYCFIVTKDGNFSPPPIAERKAPALTKAIKVIFQPIVGEEEAVPRDEPKFVI